MVNEKIAIVKSLDVFPKWTSNLHYIVCSLIANLSTVCAANSSMLYSTVYAMGCFKTRSAEKCSSILHWAAKVHQSYII